MYESLKKHSDDFHLYIFAFDDKSYNLLTRLELENTTIISLKEFEDEELLNIKDDRSTGEYCWTCTPSTIKYCIEKYTLDRCTYLDADLYFYRDPSLLVEEIGNKSVLITEHRYTPEYDQSTTSGIYCVQFVTFKNDENGMKVLSWWRDACNEWCYARFEDGKFGDQKYLDDWATRFDGVHVLENLGGGVAPWNVQQYDLERQNSELIGTEISTGKKFRLVFFHFHNFKFLQDSKVEFGTYKLKKSDIDYLYIPYIKKLQEISEKLMSFDKTNDYNGVVEEQPFHWKDPLRFIKRKIKGNYNRFSIEKLIGGLDGILDRFTDIWR